MKGNRGDISLIAEFIVVAFIMVMLLGTLIYFSDQINSALIGTNIVTNNDINISDYTADTVGRVTNAFLNNADLIGVFFLFGMILAIMFAGYLARNTKLPIFFAVEILVTVIFYILAVYISNAYEQVLGQLPYTDLMAQYLNNTSMLVLNLPLITAVVAVIMMILSYSAIPTREDRTSVPGF